MSTDQIEIVHLASDHNYLGETETWCEDEFVPTGNLAEVTCILCLKAAQIYGEGAAARLQHLQELHGPTDTKADQGAEPGTTE